MTFDDQLPHKHRTGAVGMLVPTGGGVASNDMTLTLSLMELIRWAAQMDGHCGRPTTSPASLVT